MRTKDLADAVRKTTMSQRRTAEARVDAASAVGGMVFPAPQRGTGASKPERIAAEYSVRETFSMPPADAKLIRELVVKAGRAGVVCGRSAIVRAAIRQLAARDPKDLVQALQAIDPVKPGRK